MPKILEKNGFTFYFFAADCQERPHIHIKKGEGKGKIWIESNLEVFFLKGFKVKEKREIMSLVRKHISHLKEQWYAYCNN
ncbi:DUF4160 domain-containing protein [Litoribacter populi]|uniref:DUF4160 domain-containing protein n=1 Tax=Litoribacter populi TaxID=2598460 RepID=UPI00117EBD58|nr:DUF4160 domain-containing protein [Litoribacter populi]